ncbi:DUF420 domain-containing protein [Verrucomicrobiales bacterium]|jgi:uncharacterized membrane protein YozB (DUF420 family)|nr:DUF420 domain-containing protein [Verrucomicrobiales bacterium]MDC0312564.1 DUF420 domain-containing protein [Verrucomicrobiales bacterium]MDF1788810.1 DUF420 domain-containing protein [Verrucomicrobiales bacterium]
MESFETDFSQVPLWVFDLPSTNATLNATCTVLLIAGWICIQRDFKKAHIGCMITALLVSVAFLSCYLTYHTMLQRYAGNASIRFTHQGPVRPVYFTILITHVILAAVNLPMIILTVIPACRRRFDKHKRIARWTLPVWLYVSITGVIVYLMLYQWFPSDMLRAIPR